MIKKFKILLYQNLKQPLSNRFGFNEISNEIYIFNNPLRILSLTRGIGFMFDSHYLLVYNVNVRYAEIGSPCDLHINIRLNQYNGFVSFFPPKK